MNEKKSLEPISIEVWRNFLVFHNEVIQKIEKDLQASNCISLAWYDVLIVLERSHEKYRSLSEICNETVLTKSGVTKIMNTLEREKMVIRKKGKEDGRVINAYITERGSKEVRSAWKVYKECISKYFIEGFSQEEITAWNQILPRLLNRLKN